MHKSLEIFPLNVITSPVRKSARREGYPSDKQLITVQEDAFFRQPHNKSGPRVLDLFAGAGGLSLGLELAGGRISGAIELDEWACETLALNHQQTKVIRGDIEKLTDEELLEVGAGCDVVVGGPPCQGFSIANNSAGDPADPRNSLFREFLRAVSLIRPKAVLMENVPGLLKRRVHSKEPVIEIIVSELRALGYHVDYRVLEAQSFGVPQLRPRLFVVGFIRPPHKAFPTPT